MAVSKANEIGSHREGERPQVPYALELASYAEIFEEGEPYLLDLFAATCWDASETPTVEGARQFWEHIRAQNPAPLPPPSSAPKKSQERTAHRPSLTQGRPNTSHLTSASVPPATPRRPTKSWSSEDRLSFRSLRFGAAAASCLALQLKGRSVTKIDLSNNQLGDNAAAAIASLIHSLPELKSLLLAGNILGPAGVKEIAHSELESNVTLEHLSLGEPKRQRPNAVTTEGLQALLLSLARNPSRKISSLELCCTSLRADAGKPLAEFLEKDSLLTSLDVSSNCLTSEGISTLLPACSKLQRLDIAETSCRGELIHGKLCDLLQRADNLNNLSIAYNMVEPRPLRRIARAISACSSLLTLNMAGTAMETEGVIALAEGLVNSQSSRLRDLDISENNISEVEAAVNIAKIIAQTKLHSLRLNRNPLGDGGVCELAEALGSDPSPSLTSLELGNCRVGHLGASMLFIALRENQTLLSLRLSDNLLDDTLDMTLIEALHGVQQLHLDSNRLSHRKLLRINELCAQNRQRVRTKEPRELGKQIKSLLPQEAKLKQHKTQAAKDSAEVFVRVSAQSIAGEELRQLRQGIMKSAKQTEQKIATVEATLLQRRKYLESIKEEIAATAHKNDIEIAEKTAVLNKKESALADLQARLRDLEAQLARRRAQHPKMLAEIRDQIGAAVPKTEELKAQEEEMRKELKALQDKSLIGFKP